jgi:hypothetical protein
MELPQAGNAWPRRLPGELGLRSDLLIGLLPPVAEHSTLGWAQVPQGDRSFQ